VGGRLCCGAQSRDRNAIVFLRVVEVAGAQGTLGVRVRKREREREGRREGDQSGVKSQSTSGSIASHWYEGDFDAPKLLIAPHEKA
jgi:hypothetical protein